MASEADASAKVQTMLIQKSHKIQLLPNNVQRAKFVEYAGVHRWSYNYGLERKKAEYESTGKSSGAYALAVEVTALKRSTHPWLSEAPKSIPRLALQQLDVAYANFFRRVKNGAMKPGFPRFKSRKRDRLVFHLESDTVVIDKNKARIPKLGWVRMCQPLRFSGKLAGTVAISEQAGKWFASLTVEVETPDLDERQDREVGIDLGVKTLATTSDGREFENPKHGKQLEELLVRVQRQLARKKPGSKRWQKAKLRVQRIHKSIADRHADAIHQATLRICGKYNTVYLEDLNVSGMMRNHCLARAVADASMREFRRQVEYKERWRGGTVGFVDRWFPSSKLCSECGCINDELTLADREWVCDCGTHHLRDHNAAMNILNAGRLAGAAREGRVEREQPVKRERSIVNQTTMGEKGTPLSLAVFSQVQ